MCLQMTGRRLRIATVAACVAAGSAADIRAQSLVLARDDFAGPPVDAHQWQVTKPQVTIVSGRLHVDGGEAYSRQMSKRGRLQFVLTSTMLRPASEFTDSSFGFERWTGVNGACHYGVTFKPNGVLAVLRPAPDAGGNCSGDPAFQAYPQVSNWEAIRAGGVGTTTSRASDKAGCGVTPSTH